jgi:hypothetical protein
MRNNQLVTNASAKEPAKEPEKASAKSPVNATETNM